MKLLSWGKETGVGIEWDPHKEMCAMPARAVVSFHKHDSHGVVWHLRVFSLLFWFAP